MNGSTSAKACRYFACKSTGINFTKRLIRFELSQPASTSSGGLVAGLLSKHNFRLSTVPRTVPNAVVASSDRVVASSACVSSKRWYLNLETGA